MEVPSKAYMILQAKEWLANNARQSSVADLDAVVNILKMLDTKSVTSLDAIYAGSETPSGVLWGVLRNQEGSN